MRHSLFLLLALLSAQVFAKGTIITASGGSPIPIAFSDTNSQSKVQDCQGNAIEIVNYTESQLAYGLATTSVIPGFDFAYVPIGSLTSGSGTRVNPMGGVGPGQYIYIRSASGSPITVGTVNVSCFYEAL